MLNDESEPDMSRVADGWFTARELDEIAPLAPGDSEWLGEFCVPSQETIDRIQARIEAARRLKYGR